MVAPDALGALRHPGVGLGRLRPYLEARVHHRSPARFFFFHSYSARFSSSFLLGKISLSFALLCC